MARLLLVVGGVQQCSVMCGVAFVFVHAVLFVEFFSSCIQFSFHISHLMSHASHMSHMSTFVCVV